MIWSEHHYDGHNNNMIWSEHHYGWSQQQHDMVRTSLLVVTTTT